MSEQKRIRLSGAAYRKQKLKRDEEIKKNSGSFEKYLKKNNEVLNNPETHSKIISEEPNTLEVTDSLKEVGNSEQISDSIDIFNNEINITLEENAKIRIILTMPVSVASGERSFSKLKIIKNYLRSSMNQERLSDLATISIEKEVMENLEFKNLLIDFAQEKARKINFI
ncbi:unnamed protein product [Macrosiphum euphorbiae]|uniref:HAT C-terminal dimerisation domain-containing protein n=1 Tax=Macrosiphum euphorbiae TaxID=13131 RepID=A0AAV0XA92_9HEMI|nr:unnamed protein product [Macrosiphum euphorbiae]